MSTNNYFEKNKTQLELLKEIIKQSSDRVLSDEPDELFSTNVNFFVKSYLISICTYLESYLQEVAFELAKGICERANSANIPHNFLYWMTAKEIKEKDLKFTNATFKITKEKISDELSGNPYKTIRLFRFLGINLSSEVEFTNKKDLVNALVNKRNQIVHHNNSANDISFNDLLHNIELVVSYMNIIQQCVDSVRKDAP
ncbi:MAE_28990/MAE_18760 family HEPN-like nuclease [Aeromonas caviae]|uniref:MAE_28990/MAE_18760 family HEPN-like nuclease n=1 Tax=Aeromonas caviae TaxID=648 RepID=UPI00313BE632